MASNVSTRRVAKSKNTVQYLQWKVTRRTLFPYSGIHMRNPNRPTHTYCNVVIPQTAFVVKKLDETPCTSCLKSKRTIKDRFNQ